MCTWVAAAAEALVRSQGAPWEIHGVQIGTGTFRITEATEPWRLTASFRKAFLRNWNTRCVVITTPFPSVVRNKGPYEGLLRRTRGR